MSPGNTAIPRLLVIFMDAVPVLNLLFSIILRILSAVSNAPLPSVLTRITANSSPPYLAAASTPLMDDTSIFANPFNILSPAGWPYVSLTFLKWSMSTRRRETLSLYLSALSNSLDSVY